MKKLLICLLFILVSCQTQRTYYYIETGIDVTYQNGDIESILVQYIDRRQSPYKQLHNGTLYILPFECNKILLGSGIRRFKVWGENHVLMDSIHQQFRDNPKITYMNFHMSDTTKVLRLNFDIFDFNKK